MPNRKHEAKCRQCGRCCLGKIPFWDKDQHRFRVVVGGTACQFLDPGTRKCKVYENRQFRRPGCLTIPQAKAQMILPADCPYVADDPDYECIVEDYPDGPDGQQSDDV